VRIALALRRFAPDGGTGRYAHALARSLLQGGHEVCVVCMEHSDDSGLAPWRGGALRLQVLPVPRLGSWYTMPAFARAARREVERLAPDVSLALGRVPGLDVYRAGGGCHAAYLDTVPGWRRSLRHRRELALDRDVVLGARRVVANAPLPGRQLVERYGLEAHRLVVIPNGVDSARFRPDAVARADLRAELGLDDGTPAVLFLGAGFERKGLDTAIRATATVPGAVLVAVGGDRTTGHYRALARGLGLRLELVGARSDPERWLAAADAMVLPTRYDSAANAVLEAMATGVPAVTSAANGAAAFLPEPWLCVGAADDAAGFGRALRRALDDADLSRRCRDAAELLTWTRSCDAMTTLLRELADARRAPGGSG
jgi:UDP-glucose:(heptosyl)LPS alpha-1,3-glucosyltransferase